MHFDLRQSARVLVSCILITVFTLPPSLLAQTHVVSPADLQREVMTATRARQNDIDNVKQFFSSKAAEKVLKSTHINPEQVKAAVSTLSDAELAQLASRTGKAQRDLAAGTLSDRDLIIIILAVAALVLIIVAVR